MVGTVGSEDDLLATPTQDYTQLERDRDANDLRLKRRFEEIFDKYSKDFSGIGDEIDVSTGDIVVDNGHLEHMRHEVDPGTAASSQFVKAFADNLEHEDDNESEEEDFCGSDSDFEDDMGDSDSSQSEVGSYPGSESDLDADMERNYFGKARGSRASSLIYDSEDASSTARRDRSGKSTSLSNTLENMIHSHERQTTSVAKPKSSHGLDQDSDASAADHRKMLEVRPSKAKKSSHKQQRHSKGDAIQALGQNIANQLARFMQMATDAGRKRKRKRKSKEAAWDYPDLPRKKQKSQTHSEASHPAERSVRFKETLASPIAGSLWAPQPAAARRKLPRAEGTTERIYHDASVEANNRIYGGALTAQDSDVSSAEDLEDHVIYDAELDHASGPKPRLCAEERTKPDCDRANFDAHESVPNDGFARQNCSIDAGSTLQPEERDISDLNERPGIRPVPILHGSPKKNAANIGRRLSPGSTNARRRIRRFSTAENALLLRLKEIEHLTWEQIGRHFVGRTPGGLQNHYSLREEHGWYQEASVLLKSQGYSAPIEKLRARKNTADIASTSIGMAQDTSVVQVDNGDSLQGMSAVSDGQTYESANRTNWKMRAGLPEVMSPDPAQATLALQTPHADSFLNSTVAYQQSLDVAQHSAGQRLSYKPDLTKVTGKIPPSLLSLETLPDRPGILQNRDHWSKYRTRYIAAEDIQLCYLRGDRELPWNTIEFWFPNRSGKTLGVRWLSLLQPLWRKSRHCGITSETILDHADEQITSRFQSPRPLKGSSYINITNETVQPLQVSRKRESPSQDSRAGDDKHPYSARAPFLQTALQCRLRARSGNVAPTNYYDTLVDNLDETLGEREESGQVDDSDSEEFDDIGTSIADYDNVDDDEEEEEEEEQEQEEQEEGGEQEAERDNSSKSVPADRWQSASMRLSREEGKTSLADSPKSNRQIVGQTRLVSRRHSPQRDCVVITKESFDPNEQLVIYDSSDEVSSNSESIPSFVEQRPHLQSDVSPVRSFTPDTARQKDLTMRTAFVATSPKKSDLQGQLIASTSASPSSGSARQKAEHGRSAQNTTTMERPPNPIVVERPPQPLSVAKAKESYGLPRSRCKGSDFPTPTQRKDISRKPAVRTQSRLSSCSYTGKRVVETPVREIDDSSEDELA